MMKKILTFIFLITSLPASAVPWPLVTNEKIVSCRDGYYAGPCSQDVKIAGTIGLIDVKPVIQATSAMRASAQWFAIHCQYGSAMTGDLPFRDCKWVTGINEHMPNINGDVIIDKNWNVLEGNHYTGDFITHGKGHYGAGPGAECRSFGVWAGSELLRTPFGILSATTIANSGNTYCVKAIPPDYQCDLVIPNEIFHTISGPGVDEITVHGTADCGKNPQISIVGGGDTVFAPGLTGTLKVNLDQSGSLVSLTSIVTNTGSEPGEYSGNQVIIVSPW